jgi:hypothetical protein
VAKVPSLVWETYPDRAQRFNTYAQKIIDDAVLAFRNNVASAMRDGEFPPHLLAETSNTLTIGFKTEYVSDRVVSILLSLEYYTFGAAHPGQSFIAINYDLQCERPITLPDLFVDDVDPLGGNNTPAYLEQLARLTRADLARQVKEKEFMSDAETIEPGTRPVVSNFADFTMTPGVLIIHFEPYQVGPYAAGSARVLVPWDTMKSALSPSHPFFTEDIEASIAT